MRVLTTLLYFALICNGLLAQELTIKGKVVDKESNAPIEYASISLHAISDSSIINGTITNEEGIFMFENLLDAKVFLRADFLGYQSYQSNAFYISGKGLLEAIELGIDNTKLDEIRITGRAIPSAYKVDKQVFSARQFQNTKGGNATDVIRNLPSIAVNSLGQISVRGNTGFLLLINNKAVQGDPLTILQQISANSIEDVEVVTAPSSKYDPDGNAGIINIKTKQALADGLFIIANTMLGLPSIEAYDNAENAQRYGGDFTLNYKSGKWDLSSGLDFRRYDISGRREGYVNTYLDEVLTEYPSDGERSFDEINYSGRASLSYSPRTNQSITGGFFVGKRRKERTADILYQNQQRIRIPRSEFRGTSVYHDLFLETGSLYNEGIIVNQLPYFNENLRVRKSDFFIASLDYQVRLHNQSSLSISALYERTVLGGPTDNANLTFPNTNKILQVQFNTNENPLDGFRFQLDYSKKFENLNLDMGYQYRFLQHPGDFQYFDRDLIEDQWIENPLFTNSINLERSINSLYALLSSKNSKLEYNIGLRAEYFERSVEIAQPKNTFELNRFNLFPSALLAYDLNEHLKLRASYNRRIERATAFKMTPFPEREHSETLEQGDAELLPEYIDQLELGLISNWEDNSAFLTGYYREISNVINRVNTVFNDSILNRIYTNVGTARALGIEGGTSFYPSKNLRVYLGGNIYRYSIIGELFEEAINTSNVVYSINANTTYKFTPTFTGLIAFNYLSERITAQGQDSDFYNPSLTLRKSFKKNRYSLSLQWINIDMGLWSANEQRITTNRAQFFTTTNYVYEVDIIQLNFTYKLNQLSRKLNLPEIEFGKKEF